MGEAESKNELLMGLSKPPKIKKRNVQEWLLRHSPWPLYFKNGNKYRKIEVAELLELAELLQRL